MAWCAATVLVSAQAHASDPAEDAYKSAMAIADNGDLGNARRMFERAYALTPRWKYALNVAKVALLERDLVDADRWLSRAARLAATPAEAQKVEVEQRATERLLADGGFGRLELAHAPGLQRAVATLAGRPMDDRGGSFVVWALAGRHELEIDAEGCPKHRSSVLIKAGDRQYQTIDPCRAAPPSAVPDAPTPTSPPAAATPAALEPASDATPPALAAAATPSTPTVVKPAAPPARPWPVVRLAGAAALGLGALAAYAMALDHADAARATDVVDAATKQSYLEHQHLAESWRWVAVAGGVGGAGVIAWVLVERFGGARQAAGVAVVAVRGGGVLAWRAPW